MNLPNAFEDEAGHAIIGHVTALFREIEKTAARLPVGLDVAGELLAIMERANARTPEQIAVMRAVGDLIVATGSKEGRE